MADIFACETTLCRRQYGFESRLGWLVRFCKTAVRWRPVAALEDQNRVGPVVKST
jgi:hypothetical protein